MRILVKLVGSGKAKPVEDVSGYTVEGPVQPGVRAGQPPGTLTIRSGGGKKVVVAAGQWQYVDEGCFE